MYDSFTMLFSSILLIFLNSYHMSFTVIEKQQYTRIHLHVIKYIAKINRSVSNCYCNFPFLFSSFLSGILNNTLHSPFFKLLLQESKQNDSFPFKRHRLLVITTQSVIKQCLISDSSPSLLVLWRQTQAKNRGKTSHAGVHSVSFPEKTPSIF